MKIAPLVASLSLALIAMSGCSPNSSHSDSSPKPTVTLTQTEQGMPNASDVQTSQDKAEAEKNLSSLKVAEAVDDGEYKRPKTWDSAVKYHVDAPMSTCSIREYVLYRDGVNVKLSEDCYPLKGSWEDPYTNTLYGVGSKTGEPVKVSRLQIDHIVPLKNAYMSGANKWTANTFRTYANDVNNLVTVYGSGNEAKGNKGPEEWQPENRAYHCTYATKWIDNKSEYNLTINPAEKKALQSMLNTCK